MLLPLTQDWVFIRSKQNQGRLTQVLALIELLHEVPVSLPLDNLKPYVHIDYYKQEVQVKDITKDKTYSMSQKMINHITIINMYFSKTRKLHKLDRQNQNISTSLVNLASMVVISKVDKQFCYGMQPQSSEVVITRLLKRTASQFLVFNQDLTGVQSCKLIE